MKTDLQKVEAKMLVVGDLFKHLRDNKINSVVTGRDDLYIYYKHDGMAGYVKRDTKVWRVLPRSNTKPNVMKVSQLNQDGSETPIGEFDVSMPEVIQKFLPKLPELDEEPFAQALRVLHREAWHLIDHRNNISKNDPDNTQSKSIVEAQKVIDDLSKACTALIRLQTLLKRQKNNEPLTRNQTIALGVIMRSL